MFACTACGTGGAAQPAAVDLGTPFSLRAGGSAQTRDAVLRVGFDAVIGDSRCPKGQQCVWAGDASVQVWVQQGSGPRETRVLHTAPGDGQAARVWGHELRLVRVEPMPAAGRTTASGDYTATLLLSRGSTLAAER
jgi:hypothetical protein